MVGVNEELCEEVKIMVEMENFFVYLDGWMGKVFWNVLGLGGVVVEI